LFMLLLFLRMSTTGLTAQAWGAKDPQRLARALVQPLALALGAPSTLLTSNTSSISITAIAAGVKNPERVAGLHFFNPAPVMKL
ncbi:3-hydroxyacyl-CoA dehydrogenase NAD-binding domain-containing protein, partial [Klebsiella pneumoniae]|uniref:3-hydroxyacyl-CoA dehydrogenase NAD-binding domain-containing protein n=1 Tax=Klebsiella pneumoniae TaxID=573 RepID=UPI0028F416CC